MKTVKLQVNAQQAMEIAKKLIHQGLTINDFEWSYIPAKFCYQTGNLISKHAEFKFNDDNNALIFALSH